MTAEVPVLSISSTRPIAPTVSETSEIRICSVYPVEKRAVRRHNRYTEYVLHAAPRDGYALCAVFNTFELISQYQETPIGLEQTIIPGHIPVQVVATCLISEWSSQTIASKAGYGPGIGQIAGETPKPEELNYLREKQRKFFEYLVQDGNDKFLLGQTRDITNIHRHSAHWLLGEAAQQLPWYPKMEQRSVKNCPRCAKQILAAALGCEHCSLDLIEWYDKYPHQTPDPFVVQFLGTVRPVNLDETLKAIPAPALDKPASKDPRLVQPKP